MKLTKTEKKPRYWCQEKGIPIEKRHISKSGKAMTTDEIIVDGGLTKEFFKKEAIRLQQENAELKRYNTLYFDNNIKSLREVKRLRQALEEIDKYNTENKLSFHIGKLVWKALKGEKR